MHATYDTAGGEAIREILRDVPREDVGAIASRMLAAGARELHIRDEPADEFGPATAPDAAPGGDKRADLRDWERLNWERRRRKGIMIDGRPRR